MKRKKQVDELQQRREAWEMQFKMELHSRLLYQLRQSRESLSQAQAQGLDEYIIICYENSIVVLQAQLECMPPIVLESTATACYPLLESGTHDE